MLNYPGNSLRWLTDIRTPFRTSSHMCASVTGSTEENKVPQERCFVNSWPKVFSLLCQAERNPIFIKLIKADTILLSLLSVHFSEVCKRIAILDPIFTHCLFIYDAVLFTHLTTVVLHCAETHVEKHGLVKGCHH